MSEKVLIVGAGPGGLSAAILLAAAGLKVKIIERLLQSADGLPPSRQTDSSSISVLLFSSIPRALEEIFQAAGADLWQEVELVRLDPQYRILFGKGGQLDCTSDVGRMEEAIAKLAPADAPAFRRFIAENRLKFERMKPFLASPFQSWQRHAFDAADEDASAAPPPPVVEHLSQTIFCRREGTTRILLSIEIFGHVPLQLPKPIQHSFVSRIRRRGMASGWRLRGSDRGDGSAGQAAGCGDPDRRTGRADAFREKPRDGPPDSIQFLFCGRDRDQWRFCTLHGTTGSQPAPASMEGSENREKEILLFDIHALSRHRRDVSICRTTPSTFPKTMRRT